MAEKIGEFSMEHVVSSYGRNANGDIVSTTDWKGRNLKFLPLYHSIEGRRLCHVVACS